MDIYLLKKSTHRKSLQWESSKLINEIIIEHSRNEGFSIENVYKKLEFIGAEFIQIRFIDYSFRKLKKYFHYYHHQISEQLKFWFPIWMKIKIPALISYVEKKSQSSDTIFFIIHHLIKVSISLLF